MFKDARIKCEKMALNYLDNILKGAEEWKIEILEKEQKENWDIEITTTFWGPTAWLVVKGDKVEFHFSYQPFEYKRLIEDKKIVEQIKQAI